VCTQGSVVIYFIFFDVFWIYNCLAVGIRQKVVITRFLWRAHQITMTGSMRGGVLVNRGMVISVDTPAAGGSMDTSQGD
jgi:hypothetical protein